MKHNALFYKVAKNANKLNDFSISDYDDIKKNSFLPNLSFLFNTSNTSDNLKKEISEYDIQEFVDSLNNQSLRKFYLKYLIDFIENSLFSGFRGYLLADWGKDYLIKNNRVPKNYSNLVPWLPLFGLFGTGLVGGLSSYFSHDDLLKNYIKEKDNILKAVDDYSRGKLSKGDEKKLKYLIDYYNRNYNSRKFDSGGVLRIISENFLSNLRVLTLLLLLYQRYSK